MAKSTGATKQALEKKALAASTKSEGMRMLFENGYSTAEIKELFEAPYGFVYGVGVRGGFITSTPREAKAASNGNGKAKAAPKVAATKVVAKAKAPAKAKATAAKK